MSPIISNRLRKVIGNRYFWVVVILFMIGIILHYPQQILLTDSPSPFSFLGLTRHAVERVFLLIPITLAGLVIGIKGGVIGIIISVAIMLPRVFLISSYPNDALIETGGIVVVGILVNLWIEGQKRAKEQHQQMVLKLKAADQELSVSERKYRHLFENAGDAMWVHDINGNLLEGNRSFERLSGYTIEEWTGLNITQFLSDESLALAREVRRKLIAREDIEQPYEQQLLRRDGAVKEVSMATTPVIIDGEVVGFQHIARDVTEEKRLQQNMRLYVQQVTRAQEEERKRIARELHDEASPPLLLLIQHLDAITSARPRLSRQLMENLEELRSRAIDALQGLRRCAQDLRPRILDDLGLLSALEWMAEDLAKEYKIYTLVEIKGDKKRLPAEVEVLLFRIAQEALSNVRRHAEASETLVTMQFGRGKVVLSVSDNGKGFELPSRLGDLAIDGKLGMAGMQERARLAGGILHIRSEPGKGTQVTVELPLPA